MSRALRAEPTPLNAALLRKWLVSAVARAFEPGCKVDTMLVLVGGQGLNKSEALRKLAGDERFVDTPLEVGSKDAYSKLRGRWIVEWGELASMSRAEIGAVKNFLSSRADTYRPAYGRRDLSFPRSCVFAGSTNHTEFLVDKTGDRRFWPLDVGEIDLALLHEWRGQLWAEAVEVYRRSAGQDHRWWLTPEESAALEEVHDRHHEHDSWEECVLAWAESPVEPGAASKKPVPVTTRNVMQYALHKPIRDVTRADEMRVAAVLRRAGWKSERPAKDRPRVWTAAQQRRGHLKAV